MEQKSLPVAIGEAALLGLASFAMLAPGLPANIIGAVLVGARIAALVMLRK